MHEMNLDWWSRQLIKIEINSFSVSLLTKYWKLIPIKIKNDSFSVSLSSKYWKLIPIKIWEWFFLGLGIDQVMTVNTNKNWNWFFLGLIIDQVLTVLILIPSIDTCSWELVQELYFFLVLIDTWSQLAHGISQFIGT